MVNETVDPLANRRPETQRMLRLFRYDHLPDHLQTISRPCAELAYLMIGELPDGPELTVGLRKLLEAKDCFVRSMVEALG